MDLESEKPFTGIVLGIGIYKINAFLAVEPSLNMVTLAADNDGIPFLPLEELVSLRGELCALLFIFFVRK